MLVLGRREGESVRIGDDLIVTLVRDGNKVRLGFTAPAEVPILREEVYQRQQRSAVKEGV